MVVICELGHIRLQVILSIKCMEKISICFLHSLNYKLDVALVMILAKTSQSGQIVGIVHELRS